MHINAYVTLTLDIRERLRISFLNTLANIGDDIHFWWEEMMTKDNWFHNFHQVFTDQKEEEKHQKYVFLKVLVHNPKEPNHTYDELISSFVF